jgi:hypothetical protein
VYLDTEDRELLGRARIGMLALAAPRPLVNPAAFHFGDAGVWMTTSRHAAKLTLARRDSRAAFLVAEPGAAVLLQGRLDRYDPLSIDGPVRALMEGPRFGINLAGYAFKNVPYISGYLLDLPRVPGAWWPQNRVVLRLRAERIRRLPSPEPAVAVPLAHRPRFVPADIASAVARTGVGYVCWPVARMPVLAPALWALDARGAQAWLPPGGPRPPQEGEPAALVLERHHSFRASRMLGLCLRGSWTVEPGPAAAVAARYETDLAGGGTTLRLDASRVTWWRGFEVHTTEVYLAVERPSP